MSNKVYDILKWVVVVVLPAANTLITTLAAIWGFPCDQLVRTVAAVNTFLGVVLMISNAQYTKKLS